MAYEIFYVPASAFSGIRVKRQEAEDEEELERALCKDKGAGEWFRLETGDDKCRDVIQCTASVSISNIYTFLSASCCVNY